MAELKPDPMKIAEERIEEARRTGATKLDLSNLELPSIPESLWELPQLTTLDLGGDSLGSVNKLESLPNSIGRLKRLTWLSVSENRLTQLPETLWDLTELTELHLHCNLLEILPVGIGRLIKLRILSLDSNHLENLPEEIGHLGQLTELSLGENRLVRLPDSIGQLTQLSKLNLGTNDYAISLGGNQLTSLPENIGRLTNLKSLDLHLNHLTSLPEAIGRLINLTHLTLSNNQLTSLPASLGQLTKLSSLTLGANRLTNFPDSVGRLTNLTTLDLSDNQLAILPEAIGRLTNLTHLNLSNNQLTSLPEPIGRLTNLTTLDLGKNQLTALPEAIGRLNNLTTLYLYDNQLTSLPEALGRLNNLTHLNLSYNQLVSLPEAIGRLTNLTTLDLQRNQLAALPEAIGQLTNLTELYLHGNDGLDIPPEVLGPTPWLVIADSKPAKPADILAYYFRTRQKSRPLLEAKIILLGRGEVGKTSLVKRLVHNTFDPREPITHGLNITQWPVRSRLGPVTLRVWDFGGQEIMHATHQCFLTERTLYLVVVEGRRGLADADAEYWLRFIQSFGGDSPVIVVLNKVGQFRFDLKRSELLQKFPNIKAFVHTDCANDLGIADLRKLMTAELARLPSMQVKFPTAWFAIKDRLAAMTDHYIGFEQFAALCGELGEKDTTSQNQLAGFLHALGIAINYRDDPRVSDKHILNPHWVTGGIYAIITAPALEAQGGILHPRDLASILDARTYPVPMHPYLLNLMRKFDLCFELPDESNRYLVPELLGIQEPAGVKRFHPEVCLNFEYRYTFLPEGFLPRFIARTHWHSTNRSRWRSGVILGFDGAEALVMAEPASRRVIVRVQGPSNRRRALLALIRSELDQIHTIFRANPPEAWVPIPGHPSGGIAYDDLRGFEEDGIRTIPGRIGGKTLQLDVTELLNGIDLPGTRRRGEHREQERIKFFVSYAHRDETHKATLGGHLLPLVQEGLIQCWDDRHLRPGDDWAGDIDRNLNEAEVILLLVSRHFLASTYCRNIETPAALAGSALVVPIILDDVDTTGQAFMQRQVLPTDNRPISLAKHWPDPNDGWRAVVAGLREVVLRTR